MGGSTSSSPTVLDPGTSSRMPYLVSFSLRTRRLHRTPSSLLPASRWWLSPGRLSPLSGGPKLLNRIRVTAPQITFLSLALLAPSSAVVPYVSLCLSPWRDSNPVPPEAALLVENNGRRHTVVRPSLHGVCSGQVLQPTPCWPATSPPNPWSALVSHWP